MKAALILLAFAALAGCGVDGAPIRPSLDTGVTVGENGVQTHSRVNVGIGSRINVGIGL